MKIWNGIETDNIKLSTKDGFWSISGNKIFNNIINLRNNKILNITHVHATTIPFFVSHRIDSKSFSQNNVMYCKKLIVN